MYPRFSKLPSNIGAMVSTRLYPDIKEKKDLHSDGRKKNIPEKKVTYIQKDIFISSFTDLLNICSKYVSYVRVKHLY